jgi:2-dehydro-3-deoxyglucarate aldolase
MTSSKDIRAKLRRGEPTIGAWLQLPCPDSAEIIARMGYEWAAVDMEHGSFTRAMLPDMFRALERWGALPFVRVAEAQMREIKAALDSGARGLIFPMIESREQLDKAIAWSLYPGGREFEDGRRGVGFCRANAFGLDFGRHVASGEGSGHDIVLAAQIEHVDALANLGAIFAHPRLDACMVGPYDLSASMNLTGRFDHPDFLGALAFIELKAREHGVALGYHVVQPDEKALHAKIAEGYSFLAYGIDALFLQLSGRHPLPRKP